MGRPRELRKTAALLLWYNQLRESRVIQDRMAGKDTTKHIQILDGFRGIAILGVFLYHCLGASFGYDHLAWGRWVSDFSAPWTFLVLLPCTLGWAGVAVFFVVSGFCIHLSFLKGAANDWRGYFVRRLFRIYPPYLLSVLFFACVFPPSRLGFHSHADWFQLAGHLLLLQNLDYRLFYGISGVFWSVGVEVQLYLIYPLLLAMVRKIGWNRTLLALCILESLLRAANDAVNVVAGHSISALLAGSPFCYWFSWAIGAALADAFVHKRPLPFRSVPLIPVAALAIATTFIRILNSFDFLFFALLTAGILARSLHQENSPGDRRFFAVHLRNLGICSYSFYLLHQPLIFAWGGALKTAPILAHRHLLAFACCAGIYPLIYALSRLYYRAIEAPSIAAGKRFLPGRPASKLASAR